MATRTQIQLESVPGCIHEQLCQAAYAQQRERIQALCQWMAPDRTAARQLAFTVFVGAWRRPGQSWPAVSGDHLAESFAQRFRFLFHSDERPAPAWSDASSDSSAWRPAPAPELVTAAPPAHPLRQAVSALPSAHRLLYLLHELEGYPAATLAAWLDLDTSQCARMIHEARVQLRRRLRAA